LLGFELRQADLVVQGRVAEAGWHLRLKFLEVAVELGNNIVAGRARRESAVEDATDKLAEEALNDDHGCAMV
jgi:hypothetical protein